MVVVTPMLPYALTVRVSDPVPELSSVDVPRSISVESACVWELRSPWVLTSSPVSVVELLLSWELLSASG